MPPENPEKSNQQRELEWEQERERRVSVYKSALKDWFSAMTTQFPDTEFLLVGSSLDFDTMRLSLWPKSSNYELTRKNHILAAMSDDNDFPLPSDIDVLLHDAGMKEGAVAAAEQILATHGVLIHVHTETLKPGKQARLIQDVVDEWS